MNTIGKISNLDSELIEQIIQLDLIFMDFPWKQSDWVDLDWNNHQLYSVADSSKKVKGFALYHHVQGDETAHLLKICLEDVARGSGMAKELIEQSFTSLRAIGVNSVYLEVEEGNQRAKSFYSKLGFRILRSIQGYYSNGKNALTMQLML